MLHTFLSISLEAVDAKNDSIRINIILYVLYYCAWSDDQISENFKLHERKLKLYFEDEDITDKEKQARKCSVLLHVSCAHYSSRFYIRGSR